ncbi:hypothetical protein ABZ847_29280 [Streptomyces bauhiniae]
MTLRILTALATLAAVCAALWGLAYLLLRAVWAGLTVLMGAS